jgi:VWFA-related protein
MSFWRRIVFLSVAIYGTVFVAAQSPAPPTEVLHVSSQLVVLDATVLDKAGHVVTQPLGRDDFLIEENKKPQEIYSFESAAEHVAAAASGDSEKAPLLIFVLDELNYAYRSYQSSAWNVIQQLNEYVYERQELVGYLRDQPEVLAESTEVLILTHHGYRILMEPTRDRGLLLDRVAKDDPGLGQPFRDYVEQTGYGGSADHTLTKDSMKALESLALQQRGVPGRKVVIWLGIGGPNSVMRKPANSRNLTPSERYSRELTDLLVDARITLDVIGPGGDQPTQGVNGKLISQYVATYHYESDFGFSGYITASGGQLRNGNDVRGEIQTSVNYGSIYYTTSYRPSNRDFDGQFHRIRVTVKGHPEWTVLTKGGYYAMEFGGEKDQTHQTQIDLSAATQEEMPFSAIGITLMEVKRIKNTDSAYFTFRLDSDDLRWISDSTNAVREADVTVSGGALGSVWAKGPLSSEVSDWKLMAPLEPKNARIISEVSIVVHVPKKTQRLRFAVRDLANGRIGTADINSAAVANASVIDFPTPALHRRVGEQLP